MDPLRSLRILLALSVGLNLGLLGFVVGHFLLTDEQPPSRARPAAQPGLAANILAELDEEVTAEQWGAAVARCGQLDAKLQPAARTLCDSAARERSAKESFERAHAAMIQHKYREALSLLAAIPEASVYRRRSGQLLADARRRYGAVARTDLAARAQDGECEEARQLLAEAKQVIAVDDESEALVRDCKAAVTVHEEDMRDRSRRASKKSAKAAKPTKAGPQEAAAGATFRDPVSAALLLKQAQEAYVSGNHARAILSGHQALRANPGNKQAIQIIGASACYLKNERMARWAAERLPASTRNLIQHICTRSGIKLD